MATVRTQVWNTLQPSTTSPEEQPTDVLTYTGQGMLLLAALMLSSNPFDLPVIGLSITAPLLGLVFLEIMLRPRYPFFKRNRHAIMWTIVFIVGLVVVQATSSVGSNVSIQGALIPLVRFFFWMLAFLVAVYAARDAKMLRRIALTLGCGVLLLGALRLGEAFAFGASSNPSFMTQNSYGIQFSTFVPFALYVVYSLRGVGRVAGIGMLLICIAAVMLNGSRSSWLALCVGALAMIVVYISNNPQKFGRFIFFAIIGGIVLIITYPYLPDTVRDPFTERIESFDDLDGDKSFVIRLLMVQKGLRLFEADPFFGVGVGRFRDTFVLLDIPRELSYGTQAHFNDKSAHNAYILLLGETGLAGTVPYAVLMITCVVGGFFAVRKLHRHGYMFALFAYGSLVGMSVHFWSLAGLTGTAPWFVYGYVLGLVYLARTLPADPPPALVDSEPTEATSEVKPYVAPVVLPRS